MADTLCHSVGRNGAMPAGWTRGIMILVRYGTFCDSLVLKTDKIPMDEANSNTGTPKSNSSFPSWTPRELQDMTEVAAYYIAERIGPNANTRECWELAKKQIALMVALKESEERFRTVAEYTYDWEYWERGPHEILYMTPSCERITGYTRDEFITDPGLLSRIIHPEDRHLMEAHQDDIANEKSWEMDFRIVRRDGEISWVSQVSRAVYNHDEKYNGRRVSNREITERKNIEEKSRYLAQHDLLTNLPNRALLADRLQQALAKAQRNKAENPLMALMFLDLDKLKPINDKMGHAVGELLLKETAKRLQGCVRESDTVASIGGDEFVVMLPSIEAAADALLVAEKIRQALSQPFEHSGQKLHTSASIGVAIYPEDGSNETQLSKNADDAMYRAKAGGGNKVEHCYLKKHE